MAPRTARPRRRALVVLALAAMVSTGATTAGGGSTPGWDGHADASVFHVTLNTRPAAVPVDTLLDLRIPDASSTWRPAGGGSARAALVHPGATGESGLQLLCDFGLPCPEGFPPDYPLTAHADGTTSRDAQTPSGAGRAHVGDAEVSSSVTPTHVAPLLAPLGDAVDVAAVHVSTHQRVVEGAVVVTARTRASGVDLGGGALTIDLLESFAEVRSSPDGTASTARLHLAGVRTASGDVVVGDDGIVITDQSAGDEAVEQLNAQLADALADAPMSLRVLPATTTTDDAGATTAQVRGLALSLTPRPTGPSLGSLPDPYRTYVIEGTVGEANARAQRTSGISATPLPAPAPTTPAGSPPSMGSAAAPAAPDTAAPPPAPSRAAGPRPVADVPTPSAPQVAPPSAAGPAEEPAAAEPQLLAGSAAVGAARAYLGLAALAAGSLVASRLGARRLIRPRTRP